jgi:hypothetical protein
MRKFLFLFALIVPACALTASPQKATSSAAIPACNTQERKAAIRYATVFLTIDRTSYSLKDEIVLDVGIRNASKYPDEHLIYVYSKNGWSFNGFMLEFTNQAGTFIAADSVNHVPPPPQVMGLDDPTLFVRLRPDDFLGQRGHVLLKGFIQSPGKYTLRVSYTSPALCALFGPNIQALPALWHHDPDIFSNRVSFEITP